MTDEQDKPRFCALPLERKVSRILTGENMETKTVMMPRELIAENGAKAAMIGEFSIDLPMKCCCNVEQEDCEVCGGTGEYVQPINVPWTTIKEIYKAAVKHLGC